MSALAISKRAPECEHPFYSLKEVPAWHQTIKTYLDETVFKKCVKMKDRQCEVLLNSDRTKALGLIVYKLTLQEGSTLVVRSFKIIDAKVNLEKGYQQSLLKRVVAIAKELKASKVIIDLSKKSPLVDFIQSREFIRLAGKGSAYEKMFTHYQASTAAIRLDAIAKHIQPAEEASRKRKRGVDEEPARAVGNGKKSRDLEKLPPPPVYPPSMASSYEDSRGGYARGGFGGSNYGGSMHGIGPSYGTHQNAAGVKVHKMPMKGIIYLQAIMDGIKKYEGRVHGSMYKKFKVGDELRLFDGRARWGIRCKVTSLDTFRSFREMLEAKGVVAMLPQMKDKAAYLSQEKLLEEGVRVYQSFPGSQRVYREGCVAIGVQFLEKIYER